MIERKPGYYIEYPSGSKDGRTGMSSKSPAYGEKTAEARLKKLEKELPIVSGLLALSDVPHPDYVLISPKTVYNNRTGKKTRLKK